MTFMNLTPVVYVRGELRHTKDVRFIRKITELSSLSTIETLSTPFNPQTLN